MSVEAMTLAWYVRGLTPTRKAVLVALADHADPEGNHVYPSVERLAIKTSYSVRTVRRALSDLRDLGLIKVIKESRYHSATEYRIDLTLCQSLSERPVTVSGHDLTESPLRPDTLSERPDTLSPKPSLTVIKPPEEPEESDNGGFIAPDAILCAASGLPTFPADQVKWIEVVHSCAETFGIQVTTDAMKQAADQWRKTKTKEGRPYRITNLGWIGWAQEILAGGEIRTEPKSKDEEWLDNWRQNA